VEKAKRIKKVKENWICWRLIFSDAHFDYNTVFHQMSLDEILEANAALDLYEKALKKQMKYKK